VVTFSPVKHAILSNWDFEIIFFEVTMSLPIYSKFWKLCLASKLFMIEAYMS